MNRKLSIPIMNGTFARAGREKTLAELKKLAPDYVFLALDKLRYDDERRKEDFALLKDNVAYLKGNGFKVGAWVWTFWIDGDFPFKRITGEANACGDFACPADEEFLKFVDKYFKELAETSPDVILLDDDYRFGHLVGGAACFCDEHVKMVSQKLGERLTRGELAEKALKGGPNKYRKAWLEAKGESLENYARRLRAAVDSVNPAIRAGMCACMTTWVGDGTNPVKLSKILAGDTKPFLRFIGAPYWAAKRAFGGHRLYDVVELERMQAAWCLNSGIETFNEGDGFPRPRYTCPASFLELYDTALIADGNTDGIHKYLFDYCSSVGYERGYVAYHEQYKGIREGISEIFGGKKPQGVRVFERIDKLERAELSEGSIESEYIQNMVLSTGATFFAASTIPTYYDAPDGQGVTAVFGENVKGYPYKDIKAPLILDVFAANYLKEQGVDVGLEDVGEIIAGGFEFYDGEADEYSRTEPAVIKEIKAAAGCKPMLWTVAGGEKKLAAYTYKNKEGRAFLVFAIDMRYTGKDGVINYLLQSAIIRGIEEIDKKLPAVCVKNPELYMMVKGDESTLAVGLWNCSADRVLNREIVLSGEIESVKFVNATGSFENNVVKLDDLPAYSVAAFEAKLKS